MSKILSSLYHNMCAYYPFKDLIYSHRNSNRMIMERTYYRVIDLELWFESDFEDGDEMVIIRVSEKGKYEFNRYMRCCI